MAPTRSFLSTGIANLFVLSVLVAFSAFVSGNSVEADSEGYSLYAANAEKVYQKLKDLKEPVQFSKTLEESFTESLPHDPLKLKQWSRRYKFHPEAVEQTCNAVFNNPKDYPSTTDSAVEVVSRKNLLVYVYLTQEFIDSNFVTEDFQASVFSALTSGRFTKDDNLVIAYGPQDDPLAPASVKKHGGFSCPFWESRPNWKFVSNGLNPVSMITRVPEPILTEGTDARRFYATNPVARTRKFSFNAYDACLRFARPNLNPNFLENYFDIDPSLTGVAKKASVYGLVPALIDYLSDTAQDTIWRAAMRYDSVKKIDMHQTRAEFDYLNNDSFARRMLRRSNTGIILGLRFKSFAQSSLHQMGCFNEETAHFSPDSDPDAHQYLMIFADSTAGLKEFGDSVRKSPEVREQLTKSPVGIDLREARKYGQRNMVYFLHVFNMRDAGWRSSNKEYVGNNHPQSISIVKRYYNDLYTARAKELPYCYYESYYHTYVYHALEGNNLVPETALERLIFVRKSLEILNVKKVISVELVTKSSLIPKDEPHKELSFLRNSYMSLVLGCPKLLPDPSLASKPEKARLSLCMRGEMRNRLDEDYGVDPAAKCYSVDANTVIMDRDLKRCLKEYYERSPRRNLSLPCLNPETSKQCEEENASEFDLAPYADVFMGLYTSTALLDLMKFSRFPSLYDTMIKSHIRSSNKKRVVAKDLNHVNIYDYATVKFDEASGKELTVGKYDLSTRHVCNGENVDFGTLTKPLYVNQQLIFNEDNESEDLKTDGEKGYYVWHRGVYVENSGPDGFEHDTVLSKINILETVRNINENRNTPSPSFYYPEISPIKPETPQVLTPDSTPDSTPNSAPDSAPDSTPNSAPDLVPESPGDGDDVHDTESESNKFSNFEYVMAAAPVALFVTAGSIFFVRKYCSWSQELRTAQDVDFMEEFGGDIDDANASRSYINASHCPPKSSLTSLVS